MPDTPRRIDIGFQGGQSLSVRVDQAAYDGLRKALADSGAWITDRKRPNWRMASAKLS